MLSLRLALVVCLLTFLNGASRWIIRNQCTICYQWTLTLTCTFICKYLNVYIQQHRHNYDVDVNWMRECCSLQTYALPTFWIHRLMSTIVHPPTHMRVPRMDSLGSAVRQPYHISELSEALGSFVFVPDCNFQQILRTKRAFFSILSDARVRDVNETTGNHCTEAWCNPKHNCSKRTTDQAFGCFLDIKNVSRTRFGKRIHKLAPGLRDGCFFFTTRVLKL